jgi:glucose-6-phosphate isomerase, archaeal
MNTMIDYLKHFDPNSAQIEAMPRTERRLSQLEGCFADLSAYKAALKQDDPIIYSVSSFEPANGDGDLHIGIGRVMPGKIGNEYYLTRGHLHSWREAAEIYIGLSGSGLMLLEGENTDSLPLSANSIVYVPGHTAHRTVNTGSNPLVYLGIYPAKAGHDYATISKDNFKQIVLEIAGEIQIMLRQTWLKGAT